MNSNQSFEITHDSLAAKIWEKISAEEKGLIEVRNFIVSSYKAYQDRGVLLSRKDIAAIALYENKLDLNEEMAEFVARSKGYYRKSAMLLVGLCAAIVVLGVSFIISGVRENAAIRKKIQEVVMEKRVADSALLKARENEAAAYTSNRKLKEKSEALIRQGREADSLAKVADHNAAVAESNASRAIESARKNEILKNEAQDALSATETLRDDPTQSLKRSLSMYDRADTSLKNTLKRNIYKAFEELLYKDKLDLNTRVTNIAVRPDLKYILVANGTDNVKLWNVGSGTQTTLPAYGESVDDVDASTDNRHFVALGGTRKVTFWDGSGHFEKYKEFGEDLAAVKFMRNSRQILVVYKNGRLAVADIFTDNEYTIADNLLDVKEIVLSNNNRQFEFVTLSSDDRIRFWYRTGSRYFSTELKKTDVSVNKISSIALSPGNHLLAVGTENQGLYIYDIGPERKSLDISLNAAYTKPIASIATIAFRTDMDCIVTTQTGFCYSYNLANRQTTEILGHKKGLSISCLQTLPDKDYFVTAGDDGSVKIWNAKRSKVYSFKTATKIWTDTYTVLSTEGRLSVEAARISFVSFDHSITCQFHIPGIKAMLNESKSWKGDTVLSNSDTLMVVPETKVMHGVETIEKIRVFGGHQQLWKVINAANPEENGSRQLIMYAKFSDRGDFILVKKADIDFGHVYFEIYPTFEGIRDLVDHKNYIK
jgi:WD40 repeat protein